MVENKISLKAARVNAGIKLNDIAEKYGVSRQTVIGWENGRTSLRAKVFLELCEMYKRSPEDIFLPTNET